MVGIDVVSGWRFDRGRLIMARKVADTPEPTPLEVAGPQERQLYSLLSGSCDEDIPVNRFFDEQRFGQFIQIADRNGVPAIASAKANKAKEVFLASSVPLKLHWALYGGIPYEDVLAEEQDEYWRDGIEPQFIEVDVDRMLAAGRIKEAGDSEVRLTAAEIAGLLSSQTVVVNLPAQRARVALKATGGQPVRDIPRTIDIPNLASFFAQPQLHTIGGEQLDLDLSTANVSELRHLGRTDVHVADQKVEVRYNLGAAGASGSITAASGGVSSVRSRARGTAHMASTTPAPIVPKLGVYLPWRQFWKLEGYSRGRLLHTTALAPQEQVTIELLTWDRLRRSLDQTTETDIDQTFESTDTSRDVSDVMTEATSSSELQARADASFDYSAYGATISVGGGVSFGKKLGEQAKATTNKLHDSVKKAAARVRTRRVSRLTETREYGREERITRQITNASECHALTIQHFEVIAGYELTTEFLRDEVRPVVLISNPMRTLGFDNRTVRQYESSLRASLFDRSLEGGFDAAKFNAARAFAKGLVCDGPSCDNEKDTGGGDSSAEPVDLTELIGAMDQLVEVWASVKSKTYAGVFDAMDEGGRHELEPTSDEMRSFRIWLTYRLLVQTNGAVAGALDQLQSSSFTSASTADVVRPLAQRLAAALPTGGLETLLATMNAMTPAKRLIARSHVFDYAGNPSAEADWWNGRLEELGLLSLDDGGMTAAIAAFLNAWEGTFGSTLLSPAAAGAIQAAQKQADRLSAADRLEAAFGLRDSAHAAEREEALLLHLAENANYYRHAVFAARPVAEQLIDLSRLGVDIEMIEPRVIGSVADSLVLPISPAWSGFEALQTQVSEWLDEMPKILPITTEVTLPTPGLLAQTFVDDGCACGAERQASNQVELRAARVSLERQIAELELVQSEGRRYRDRLEADELDDPDKLSDPLEQGPVD